MVICTIMNNNTVKNTIQAICTIVITIQVICTLVITTHIGKSSLVVRFVKGEFSDSKEPTIGGEFSIC